MKDRLDTKQSRQLIMPAISVDPGINQAMINHAVETARQWDYNYINVDERLAKVSDYRPIRPAFIEGERLSPDAVEKNQLAIQADAALKGYTILPGYFQEEFVSTPSTTDERIHFISKKTETPELKLETESNILNIGGKLYYKDLDNGTVRELVNCDIRPLYLILKHHRDGEIEIYFVVRVIQPDASQENELKIRLQDITKIANIIRARIPGIVISADVPNASQRICNYVSSQSARLEKRHYYCEVGWWRGENGQHFYAHDKAGIPGVVCETGKSITLSGRSDPKQAFQNAQQFGFVSPERDKSLTLLLVAHLALLSSIFRDAGHEIHFVTFIEGESGSLKTAVATCLFALFDGSEKEVPANFADTTTALEHKMFETADSVLVMDDYHPATSKEQGNRMVETLETLIRFYGDGVGKARGTADGGIRRERRPQGIVVVTGEDRGGSHSSRLRSLFIQVHKSMTKTSQPTFIGEHLKIYQNDPSLLRDHYYYFIEYIASRYDDYVAWIHNNFDELRRFVEKSGIKEKRLVDVAVQLMLTANIVLDYGENCGAIKQGETGFHYEAWVRAIIAVVRTSEAESADMDPSAMYLYAIKSMMDAGELRIAKTQPQYGEKPAQFDGFYWAGDLCLEPDHTHEKVLRFWASQKKHFSPSQHKISRALYEAGVLIVQTEERNGKVKVNYRYKSSLKNRATFWRLSTARMELILDKEGC